MKLNCPFLCSNFLERIRSVIVLDRIVQTCNACPSQWDAWDTEGNYYYIRYRWGFLSVDKGSVRGERVFEAPVGDGLDGCMSTDEMLNVTGMKLA